MSRIIGFLARGLALAGLAWLGAAHAAGAFPPLSFQRRIAACISCHRTDGRGGGEKFYPRLAGQPAAYLAAQLKDFQTGQRINKTMHHMVARLPSSYLWAMARYFAPRQAPYPPVRMNGVTAAELERGERLVRRGRWRSGVPACTTCHGDHLGGHAPATPLLAGQYEAYLADQLGAWRAGERRSDRDGLMRWIAHGLSDRDIADISAYLAALRPGDRENIGLSLFFRTARSTTAGAANSHGSP